MKIVSKYFKYLARSCEKRWNLGGKKLKIIDVVASKFWQQNVRTDVEAYAQRKLKIVIEVLKIIVRKGEDCARSSFHFDKKMWKEISELRLQENMKIVAITKIADLYSAELRLRALGAQWLCKKNVKCGMSKNY